MNNAAVRRGEGPGVRGAAVFARQDASREFAGVVYSHQLGPGIGEVIEQLELLAHCADYAEVVSLIIQLPQFDITSCPYMNDCVAGQRESDGPAGVFASRRLILMRRLCRPGVFAFGPAAPAADEVRIMPRMMD